MRWIVVIGLVLGTLVVPSGQGVSSSSSGSAGLAERTFHPWTSREMLGSYLGKPPRCATLSDGITYCTWLLNQGSRVWEPLAKGMGIDTYVSVVCRFPESGERSHRSWCQTWPANAKESPFRGRGRNAALATLAQALTLDELVALMGAGPYTCERPAGEDTEQVCRWRTGNRTLGYAVLRTIVDAEKRVELACQLESADVPRDPDGCTVEELGGE